MSESESNMAGTFPISQLRQRASFVDPEGKVESIADMPLDLVKRTFNFFTDGDVAVRLRAMAAMEELGITGLPDGTDEEKMETAIKVSEHIQDDQKVYDIPDPFAYARTWMLDQPLVQALFLRIAEDMARNPAESIEDSIPDALPEDFS